MTIALASAASNSSYKCHCLGDRDDKIPAWPLVHCGFIWTS